MKAPFRFGRFELIPATRQLLAEGGAVTLGSRAFDVLVALVERRDRLVTKEELLELAWPGLVVEENNLQVQISALRKALGSQAIATIPGKGYRFAAKLVSDAPAAPERLPHAPERRTEPRPWLVPSQSEGPRLAAVIFTDVVGYSARMQKDEAGTIALVKADFERMRTFCGRHGGESLNTMGDGLLLCFPSALQAVSCALQIQREFSARKLTDPHALEHRIGLHLGDVFHLDTGDVAGDGINIASRIESKASPGGICMSQTIYDTVKGKIGMDAIFLGQENFKNIAHPIPIWHVAPLADASQGRGDATERHGVEAWRAPDAKSIAVLPFTNMSDDKDTGYFADGVHDDLLTQLSFVGDLKVVSRTSVLEYRDTKKKVFQIASELGVRVLVEGSVRRAGNRVRVSAQLIDAHSDSHLWARSYDRELTDIFAIQSELATEIARALKVSLSPQQQARLASKPTENLAAYDLYQRHQDLLRRALVSADEKLDERIELLARVVELDPKFALAWAHLGTEHARMHFYQRDPTEARLAKAQQATEQARALAPDDLSVKIEVGNFYYYGLRGFARAAAYLEDLLRVAPNNVSILTQLSWVRRRLGRWPEANAHLERALAIDPRNLNVLHTLRQNLQVFRHEDEAIALQRRITAIQPDSLDEQERLHGMEWMKSGSSAAYVAWRAALPEEIVRESPAIWHCDFRLALVKGDADTAVRMLETPRAPRSSSVVRLAKGLRALLLLGKGERARAHQLARASLTEAEAVLKERPDDIRSLWKAMLSYAILGEQQPALEVHKRVRQATRPGAFETIEEVSSYRVLLYAGLGDRDSALRALERLLKHQAFFRGEPLLAELSLLPLKGDPRLEALLKDPANKAPLAIVNWDLEKMPVEL